MGKFSEYTAEMKVELALMCFPCVGNLVPQVLSALVVCECLQRAVVLFYSDCVILPSKIDNLIQDITSQLKAAVQDPTCHLISNKSVK